jgi:hypothetical protein
MQLSRVLSNNPGRTFLVLVKELVCFNYAIRFEVLIVDLTVLCNISFTLVYRYEEFVRTVVCELVVSFLRCRYLSAK